MGTAKRRRIGTFAGVSALALIATGCSLGDEPPPSAQGNAPVDCRQYADYGKFDGAEVTIMSGAVEVEAEKYERSFHAFEECTGLDIRWDGRSEFEATLKKEVEAGTPPDLATPPQPGLIQQFAQANALTPLSEKVGRIAQENFTEDWLEYGTVDGQVYAIPLGAHVKSLVWYSPYVFRKYGWGVPRTWSQMLALSDKMVAAGITPWCAGIESGDATGWPATDWIEDVLLRTAGPDVYDQWLSHEIPFNDPAIKRAFDVTAEILKNPKYSNGGYGEPESIVKTAWNDGGYPIIDEQCGMHRAASFYIDQWPSDVTVGEDAEVWVFTLPPRDPKKGLPILGSSDFLVAFNNRPETEAVQAFIASAAWSNAKAQQGAWFSANQGLELANVANPVLRRAAQILQDPEVTFRFDASDLMPASVGGDSFWKQITAWLDGQSTTETLDNIEKSWPS